MIQMDKYICIEKDTINLRVLSCKIMCRITILGLKILRQGIQYLYKLNNNRVMIRGSYYSTNK